ncbi:hypothetical protein GWR56_11595 [Mucilaginibacter sp. 14171R-50]|uniref:hypothetical protein n=1 Tax=Mucilaginibacter sp. 14171R-50 TaxID=2703789 RepID=UPI00138C4E34|nr:hypothetical protein [Mucilaginibacter sp. 14171R-50]QHS56149.1 hypothetical protein GWR56_11595 [Mucilaginibacter sp. 14171R-50]
MIANVKASADTLIAKLINTVYKQVVDPKAKFYYLHEFGEVPKFDKYDLNELKGISKAQEIPLSDFVKNVANDTGRIIWSDYNIIKAKIALEAPVKYTNSYRIIRRLPFKTPDAVMRSYRNKGIIPVRQKTGYSAQQLKIEEAKAIEQYEKSFSIEEKHFYHFTKPVFSSDRTFVLIGLNDSDRGCLYIFKLVNGEWVKVLRYKCWVA